MLQRFAPCFEQMEPEELAFLWPRLRHLVGDPPECPTGRELFDRCVREDVSHATVVLSIARETGDMASAVATRLVGRPMRRPAGAPVPARRGGGAPRGPRPSVPKTDPRIIVHVQPNPKRPGAAAHARYEAYEVGISVSEAMRRGVTVADVKYDLSRGYIRLEDK